MASPSVMLSNSWRHTTCNCDLQCRRTIVNHKTASEKQGSVNQGLKRLPNCLQHLQANSSPRLTIRSQHVLCWEAPTESNCWLSTLQTICGLQTCSCRCELIVVFQFSDCAPFRLHPSPNCFHGYLLSTAIAVQHAQPEASL